MHDLGGGARVRGALQNNKLPFLQTRQNSFRGLFNKNQIGGAHGIIWRGHANKNHIAGFQRVVIRRCGEETLGAALLHILGWHIGNIRDIIFQRAYFFAIHIHANNVAANAGKRDGKRQAHIAQANDGYALVCSAGDSGFAPGSG